MSKGLTIGELYKVGKKKYKPKAQRVVFATRIAEANYRDDNTGGAATSIDSTGSIFHLNPIAVGTSVNTRQGKAVRMKSVQIRAVVSAGTTTTVATAVHVLVLDRKPSGALPNINTIFDVAADFTKSMLADTGSTRYKILKRWNHVITGNSTTPATGGERHFIDDYVLLPYDAVWTVASTTGVIADMVENALYLVRFSDVAAGTAAPVGGYRTRVRFYDQL